MHKYIEGETIGEAELKAALRRATLKMKVFPGNLRNGLQEQGCAAAARCGRRLSAFAARCSPGQGHQSRHRRWKKSVPPTTRPRSSALAFKIMTDPFVGQLTFIRVYSGQLKTGDSV